MIIYPEHDMTPYNEILAPIINKIDEEVSDQDVWKMARKEKGVPRFENIAMILACSLISDWIESQRGLEHLKFESTINGFFSQFSINGEEIQSPKQFFKIIKKEKHI